MGYAVSWLNEAKTRIFQPIQPILKFSKFTCILSACQPAVRPGCARCRAPEISHDKGNQEGVAPIASVLPSATAVKIKVNGQLEIFFIVNSQATIPL